MSGILLVSLDFELFWGMQDVCKLPEYQENILGARKAIPNLLKLFEQNGIHATWATVGFLFGKSKHELMDYFPDNDLQPTYDNSIRSSYRCFDNLGLNEEEEPCFFASSLIELVRNTPGQEVGCHTFSHYYCNEGGQTVEQFEADLIAAKKLARHYGYELKSLILPRNQCRDDYIRILNQLGFQSYRGVEDNWIHNKVKFVPLKKVLRLLDIYFPLTGGCGYLPQKKYGVWNFHASKMFKPYFKPLFFIERLKIYRIKRQMLRAAKKGEVYHLWWHPHNIGIRTAYHLECLKEIFNYYLYLNNLYGMKSMNMEEAAEFFDNHSIESEGL